MTDLFQEPADAFRAAKLEQIRGFLVQLDATFHARLNILLVAESLFIAAVSQIWSSKETVVLLLVCAVALVVTMVLWKPLDALASRTAAVASVLHEDALYKFYIESSRAPLKFTNRLANSVPILFLATWLILGTLALVRGLKWYPPLFNF